MQRRQRRRVGGLLALSLAIGGCSQPGSTGFELPRVVETSGYVEKGDLEAIKARGQLRLLVVERAESVTRLPRPGLPINSQLRAATRFARAAGLKPVVVLVQEFDALIPALRSGAGDVIVANLAMTSARGDRIDFTVALDRSRHVLVARADDKLERPTQLDDRTIAVGIDSPFWATVKALARRHEGLEIRGIRGLSRRLKFDLLAAGEIDLTLASSNALSRVLDYRDALRAVFPVSPERGIALGVRESADRLKDVLNEFISQRELTQFDKYLHTGDLPRIKALDTLRVATRNSAVNYFIWRGQLMGFEYELAKRFAKSLGVRLEVVVADPGESLRQLVRSGRADMAAAFLHKGGGDPSGLSWSRPYHYAVLQVVSRAGGEDIETLADLAGHRVRVHRGSRAWKELRQLQRERNIDLELVPLPPEETAGTAIRKVARGVYDVTVVGDHLAKNAAAWRDNISAGPEFGEPVAHRWVFRADSGQLRAAANRYLEEIYESTFYNVIYAKYFRDHDRIRAYHARRVGLDSARQISRFDELIKHYARKYDFDWRLIAAQIYQESSFNPNAKSWAGARGLMQVMPATAEQVGVEGSLFVPEVNIRAGVRYLAWLRARFEKSLRVQSRMWFVLASYNAGLGHVSDARRLAERLELDPDRWFNNVERAMLKLAQEKYYSQARFGYVRGRQPVHYVRRIRQRYQAYILWTNDCWPRCQQSPHPTVVRFTSPGPGLFAYR